MEAVIDLAAIPRELPQFGRSVWNVMRHASDVWRGALDKDCSCGGGHHCGGGCECGGSEGATCGCGGRTVYASPGGASDYFGWQSAAATRVGAASVDAPPDGGVWPHWALEMELLPPRLTCAEASKQVRSGVHGGVCEQLGATCPQSPLFGWECKCVSKWRILPKGKEMSLAPASYDWSKHLFLEPRVIDATEGSDCSKRKDITIASARNTWWDRAAGCRCLCWSPVLVKDRVRMLDPAYPGVPCITRDALPPAPGGGDRGSLTNWDAFPSMGM